MNMRERTWTAVITMGWAVAAVQLLTLRWTPDCGGVAYGAPLPYVATSLASSLEFRFLALPFALDLLAYAALLAVAARPLLRWVGRNRRWTQRVAFALLLPWSTLLYLEATLALRIYRPELAAVGRLRVYEWRSIDLFFGPPSWDTHLEPHCD
jgi:hypothetical protein